MTTTHPSIIHYQHTLVVGLGATGWSVVRYLLARGEPVAVADSRPHPPYLDPLREQFADVPVFLGTFSEQVFALADRIVVSPGITLDTPAIVAARARGVPVISDIELFTQAVRAPVVAITGSNGKSTVTTLVGQMAQTSGISVAIGGNLGTPALDLLDTAAQLYVLELSSFQLESTHSLRAQVACVLNISADHLDRHGDLQCYTAVKAIALQGAKWAVLNADDPQVQSMPAPTQRLSFSLQSPSTEHTFGIRTMADTDWLCRGDQPLLSTTELRLAGRHNYANALASLAIGTALALPLEPMLAVLRTFSGLPHRMALVTERHGVRWYNDSKATNVGAAIAALEGLYQAQGGRAVILLGGTGKSADFAPLRPVLARCARAVVLFGQDRAFIQPHVPSDCQLVSVDDLTAAVAQAATLALPGDHVLFAPACASWDQFPNFAARGERFTELVAQL